LHGVSDNLVFKREGGARVAVEVQGEPDDEKWRRWATTMAARQEATGLPGDLIVITTSPAVAAWAKTVAHVRGPLGTTMTVTPV
jgi:predicted alpha/beta hydrolase family esterase